MGDVLKTPWSGAASWSCGRQWRFLQMKSDIDVASEVMLKKLLGRCRVRLSEK